MTQPSQIPEADLRTLLQEQRASDRERTRNDAIFQEQMRAGMANLKGGLETVANQVQEQGRMLKDHESRIEKAERMARKAHDSSADLEGAVTRHLADQAKKLDEQLSTQSTTLDDRLTQQDKVLKRLSDAEDTRDKEKAAAEAVKAENARKRKEKEEKIEQRQKRIESWSRLGTLAIVVLTLLSSGVSVFLYLDARAHGEKPPPIKAPSVSSE